MAKLVGLGGFFVSALVAAAVAVTGIVFLFIYAILGALFGAVAGWFVQATPVIGPAVRAGFAELGFGVDNLAAVGAALGFVSGFFKETRKGGREEW
jgi:hypothetical protein